MKTFRNQRLSSLIIQELNNLLLREVEFDGALATITYCEINPDTEIAEIGISVIPEAKGEEIVTLLNKKAPGFAYKLIRIVNIKRFPKLQFSLDHGMAHAAEIERALMYEVIPEEKEEGVE